jgi:hypothetical protein
MSSTTNNNFGIGHSGSDGGTGELDGICAGARITPGGKTVEVAVMVESILDRLAVGASEIQLVPAHHEQRCCEAMLKV